MKGDLTFKAGSRQDKKLVIIMGGILGFTTLVGLLLLFIDAVGALILFGTTLLVALLFWITMPRQYLIYNDRMVIKLGGPFSFRIALDNINTAKLAKPDDTIAYSGLKFVTTFSGGVEIIRHKGWSLIITPEEPSVFLSQLDEARQLFYKTNRA